MITKHLLGYLGIIKLLKLLFMTFLRERERERSR